MRSTYSDKSVTGTAPLDPLILPELALLTTELDQMSTKVPVDRPWSAANAAQWDSQTLQDFVNTHVVSPRLKKLVSVFTQAALGAEPSEFSLLFTLFYIAAAGDENNAGTIERLFDTPDGAQESRFIGGSQLVAQRVANQLGSAGGSAQPAGPAGDPGQRRSHRRGRRAGRPRPAGDRRRAAGPRRADRLPPGAAAGPRGAATPASPPAP